MPFGIGKGLARIEHGLQDQKNRQLAARNRPTPGWGFNYPLPPGYPHRKQQPNPPYYTGLQCSYGPPGPYIPNNKWTNGRPNGNPETCSNGNPWMYHVHPMEHVDPYSTIFCPRMHSRRHHRHPHRRRVHYEDEDEDDGDSEDDDSESDLESWDEIYDGDSAATQWENMSIESRRPHRGPRHGRHHGLSHHCPHGLRHSHRHRRYPEELLYHGHRGDRVAGLYPRDPYRTGHGYEGSFYSPSEASSY